MIKIQLNCLFVKQFGFVRSLNPINWIINVEFERIRCYVVVDLDTVFVLLWTGQSVIKLVKLAHKSTFSTVKPMVIGLKLDSWLHQKFSQ